MPSIKEPSDAAATGEKKFLLTMVPYVR
jgi:hypothetical protein